MELSKVTLEIFTKLEQKWLSHYESTHKVCILIIDSSGTSGIVAGPALAHLEDQIRLKTRDLHASVVDFFDIVTGTGIDGILAAMLCAADDAGKPLYSARTAVNLISERNSEFFKARSSDFIRRKYRFSSKSMDKVLKEFSREKTDEAA